MQEKRAKKIIHQIFTLTFKSFTELRMFYELANLWISIKQVKKLSDSLKTFSHILIFSFDCNGQIFFIGLQQLVLLSFPLAPSWVLPFWEP